MSDEAMLQIFDGDKTKLKYDLKTCRMFLEKVDEILKELDREFSATEVECALFTMQLMGSDKPEKGPSDSISPLSTKAKKRPAKEEGAMDDKPASKAQKTGKVKSSSAEAKGSSGSKRHSLRK